MSTGRHQDQPDPEQSAVPETTLVDLEPADVDADVVTGGSRGIAQGDGG